MKRSLSVVQPDGDSNESTSTGKTGDSMQIRIPDSALMMMHLDRSHRREEPLGNEKKIEPSIRTKTYCGFHPRSVSPHHAPDVFFEGECDVGPRPILSPLHIDSSCRPPPDSLIMEAVLWFNKGIGDHSGGDHESATEAYGLALGALSKRQWTLLSDSESVLSCLAHIRTLVHNNMGQISYLDCDECDALSHFTSALASSKQVDFFDDEVEWMLTTATLTSNLARTLWMTGDVFNADLDTNLQEVLRLRSLWLLPEHPDVACAHLNLGFLRFRRDDKANAKVHLLEYLKYAKHDDSILDPIPAMAHILLMDYDGKKDRTSKELVRTSQELLETRRLIGDVNVKVSSLLNYLGTMLFNLRRFEESMLFYTRELELEGVLSENIDGIRVSVTLNNIGRTLQELGKLSDAISYYEKALQRVPTDYFRNQALDAHVLSNESTRFSNETVPQSTLHLFSTIWYNLGLIHDRRGCRGEAISAFKMSLKLRRRMFGAEHQDVACLWYNIGTLQMENNQVADASASLQEAMRIKRKGFSRGFSKLVRTLSKLACLQEDRGRIVDAFAIREEILHIQTAAEDASAVALTLLKMSELRFAQGLTQKALELAQKSLRTIFQSDEHKSEHFYSHIQRVETVAKTLIMIGSLHHELMDMDLARDNFLKAQEVLEEATRLRRDEAVPQLVSLLAGLRLLGHPSCAPQA
ncbi:hypothetical protein MHU86_20464 [Fragilaria crotonensis]|nr:hypothetical protein MHU86_20464 [Fragilaria crotonensis]